MEVKACQKCDRNEFIISTAVVDRMSPYRNLNLNLLVSPPFFVRVHALRGFNMFGIVVDLIKLHVTRIFAHVHFASAKLQLCKYPNCIATLTRDFYKPECGHTSMLIILQILCSANIPVYTYIFKLVHDLINQHWSWIKVESRNSLRNIPRDPTFMTDRHESFDSDTTFAPGRRKLITFTLLCSIDWYRVETSKHSCKPTI